MNQIKTQNDSVYLMWTCSESEIRLAKMHMHKTLIFYIHHPVFLKYVSTYYEQSVVQHKMKPCWICYKFSVQHKLAFICFGNLLHHSWNLRDFFSYFAISFLIKLFSMVFSQLLIELQIFQLSLNFVPICSMYQHMISCGLLPKQCFLKTLLFSIKSVKQGHFKYITCPVSVIAI